MAHVIEAAATGRSKCRACGARIAARELRFGERMPNPFADGEITQWFHPECGAFARPEPFLEALANRGEPLEESERLESEARLGLAHHRVPRIRGAERSPTGRARCRSCREVIAKDAWRVPLVFYEEGRFVASGSVHVRCARAYFETVDILPRVRRFSPLLTDGDLQEIARELEA
jgi:Poly(ADP-ribose) polymerase and DNA-Ligase Zn-finger region